MLSRITKRLSDSNYSPIPGINKNPYSDKKKESKAIVSYISLFPTTGYMYCLDQTSGVFKDVELVASDFLQLKQVENLAKIAHQYLDPNTLKEIEKDRTTDTLGFKIVFKGKEFCYGPNPKKVENTEKALEYLLQELEAGLLNQDPTYLIRTLQQTHSLFFKNISSEIQPGVFRKIMLIVPSREDSDLSLRSLFKKYGANKKDLLILDTIIAKTHQNKIDDVFSNLSKEECALIGKFVFLPPPSKEVPSLMDTFAKEFLSLYKEDKEKSKIDYIKLAVFAHQKIIKIHPFEDGNGRVARAFMNALLIQGGLCPVFFPNDYLYNEHIKKSDAEFEEFLRTTIKSTKVAFKSFVAGMNIPIEPQADEMSLPTVSSRAH